MASSVIQVPTGYPYTVETPVLSFVVPTENDDLELWIGFLTDLVNLGEGAYVQITIGSRYDEFLEKFKWINTEGPPSSMNFKWKITSNDTDESGLSSLEPIFSYKPNIFAMELSSVKSVSKGWWGTVETLEFVKELSLPLCTEVGEEAFKDSNLKYVNLQSAEKIMVSAFEGCISLVQVDIPVCHTLQEASFKRSGLKGLDAFALKSVSDSACEMCVDLTHVNAPLLETVGGFAFEGCVKLLKIDFPECTKISDEAFQGSSALEEVVLPKCNTMGPRCFQNCTKLARVSAPLCTDIETGAFHGCDLKTLFLSSYEGDSTPLGDLKNASVVGPPAFQEINGTEIRNSNLLTWIADNEAMSIAGPSATEDPIGGIIVRMNDLRRHPLIHSLKFQDFDVHDVLRPILNTSLEVFQTKYVPRIVSCVEKMSGVIADADTYRLAENDRNISVVALVSVAGVTQAVHVIKNGRVFDGLPQNADTAPVKPTDTPFYNETFVIGIMDPKAPYTVTKYNYGNTVTAFLRMMLQLENGEHEEASQTLVSMRKDLKTEQDLLSFLQSSKNAKVAQYLETYGDALKDLESNMHSVFEELVRVRDAVKTAGGTIGNNSEEVAKKMAHAIGRVVSMKSIINKYRAL